MKFAYQRTLQKYNREPHSAKRAIAVYDVCIYHAQMNKMGSNITPQHRCVLACACGAVAPAGNQQELAASLAVRLDHAAAAAARERSRTSLSRATSPMAYRGGRPNEEDEHDDFYSRSGETQKLLLREQDDTLKQLANSVDRVQSMAIRVNDELADQNRLLTDIDDEVDRTESKLASVHKSLKMLANDSDRGKYCVILLLMGLLVWLIMMVLE